MTEAVQNVDAVVHRYKRGDVRDDGNVFWGYNKNYKTGQVWITKPQFDQWKKNCKNSNTRYEKNNAEKMRESRKEWTKKNRIRVNKKKQEWRKKFRKRENELARINYHKNKSTTRNRQLKDKFGISLYEYDELLKKQNNKCAICESISCKSGNRFAVDHDHKTGIVRGLLCLACNTSLGQFNDSQELLYKAISYLQKTTHIEPINFQTHGQQESI